MTAKKHTHTYTDTYIIYLINNLILTIQKQTLIHTKEKFFKLFFERCS